MIRLRGRPFFAGLWLIVSTVTFGFENTKVLPKGVRNLTIKNLQTTIDQKSDQKGSLQPLSKPLAKDLKFKNIVNGEEGVKKAALEAFLNYEKFNLDDSVGKFYADMQGSVRVVAPIFSYGLTENLTIAIAIPYYHAKMGINLAFRANQTADDFIMRLHSEGYNQTAAAQEAADKMRDAVGELNKKLVENNYRPLENWEGQGLGDMTVAAKYRFYNGDILKISTTNGLMAPTGKTADPNILNGIPFGDGGWDIFSSIGFDEYLSESVFLNQYVKYSYQTYARRDIRLATEDESIEVPLKNTRYKLGDKIDAGLSLQYEPSNGLVSGIGYTYFNKYGDRYELSDFRAAKAKIEGETDETNHYGEARLGYSSVPAFQRGEFGVPFSATLEYKKHLASKHSVVRDMVSVDFAMFF